MPQFVFALQDRGFCQAAYPIRSQRQGCSSAGQSSPHFQEAAAGFRIVNIEPIQKSNHELFMPARLFFQESLRLETFCSKSFLPLNFRENGR